MAETWHGPYQVQGNPHRNDPSNTSFHSQISSVFKVHGKKDLYIACADRWLPEYTDLNYEDYKKGYELLFHPEEEKRKSLEEILRTENMEGQWFRDNEQNTAIADYVWLPLKFDGETVFIEWMDEWKMEDFK